LKKGIWYALGAYTLWGVFPIFWKLLQSASASEIVAHRMVWSLVFLAAILSYRRQWQWMPKIRRNRRAMGIFALTAALLGANWLIYVWGVNTGEAFTQTRLIGFSIIWLALFIYTVEGVVIRRTRSPRCAG